MVISLLFMKLYAFYQPYDKDEDDQLQEVAQYQIFATLFFALIIKTGQLKLELLRLLLPANNPIHLFYFTQIDRICAWKKYDA